MLAGNEVGRFVYRPFGEAVAIAGGGVPAVGFTNQRRIPAAGLHDYRARIYDPRVGRFLQPDVLVSSRTSPSQALDRYSYVGNDPVDRIDPTGMDPDHDPEWIYFPPSYEGYEPLPSIDNPLMFPTGPSPTQPSAFGIAVLEFQRVTNEVPPTDSGVVAQSGGSIGAPGFAESLIPVWGSGRAAINDFQEGNYGWAAFDSAVAVSDVFVVGAAVKGIAKGAFKVGSHTWRATRSWYGQTRNLEAGTPVHHWLVEQGSAIGKQVPDAIKNQPWNLMPMRSQAFHNQVHGWGPDAFNATGQLWYGTPGWAKAGAFSTTGHAVEAFWGP